MRDVLVIFCSRPRLDTLALLAASCLSCLQMLHRFGVLTGLSLLTGVVDPSLLIPKPPGRPGTVTILGSMLRWSSTWSTLWRQPSLLQW